MFPRRVNHTLLFSLQRLQRYRLCQHHRDLRVSLWRLACPSSCCIYGSQDNHYGKHTSYLSSMRVLQFQSIYDNVSLDICCGRLAAGVTPYK
jgi:hypothetical protein